MKERIVADSCCDIFEFTDDKINIPFSSVPLKILVDDHDFIDDKTLDLNEMIWKMDKCSKPSSTSCPSPDEYAQEFRKQDITYAVTLSSKLSGSYNSAVQAKNMVLEEESQNKIHVIDSKSASAAEIAIVLKLRELIQQAELTFDEIVEIIDEYRDKMATFFVLHKFDNFIKSGRMSAFTGALAKVLLIHPICGDDGDGNIKIYDKVPGQRKALKRMVEMISQRTDPTGKTMIITHCNNPEGAQFVKEVAMSLYKLKDVLIYPMRGLSSYYASVQGIILAV